MENASKYDPSRKTVGAIYRDAQMANTDLTVVNGDMTNELKKSLVDDLNDTIVQGSKEYEGQPFYITVHEKKDLAMPHMLHRRMIKTKYRPWPEDDTIVFAITPSTNDVKFCWCLPHWSEMENMLNNKMLFEPSMIRQIMAWKNFNLYYFGFTKDEMGNWIVNLTHKDFPLECKAPIGCRILII